MLPIIEQRHTIIAPLGAVIAGFSDAAVLKAAIPRCREVRRLSDTKFWILTDIGVLKWTFLVEGIVTLKCDGPQIHIGSDLRTKAFRLGRADTVLTMTDASGNTLVHSKTTLLPARQHSALVRRTISAVARKLLDGFFLNFQPDMTV
jgi:carbon monoxide dehydrogenase subunit G